MAYIMGVIFFLNRSNLIFKKISICINLFINFEYIIAYKENIFWQPPPIKSAFQYASHIQFIGN